MSVGLSFGAFVLGAMVSLATSWVLVSRLERVGERFGLSEALLGLVAALAADAPEITASVTASSITSERSASVSSSAPTSSIWPRVLGLGAVVAGGIALHRKVVVLGGAIALFVAALVCAGWWPEW